MTDECLCDLCGAEDGGFLDCKVGGIDPQGEPMSVDLNACEECAGGVLIKVIRKVPAGSAVMIGKRDGRLTIDWHSGDALDEQTLALARKEGREEALSELAYGRSVERQIAARNAAKLEQLEALMRRWKEEDEP